MNLADSDNKGGDANVKKEFDKTDDVVDCKTLEDEKSYKVVKEELGVDYFKVFSLIASSKKEEESQVRNYHNAKDNIITRYDDDDDDDDDADDDDEDDDDESSHYIQRKRESLESRLVEFYRRPFRRIDCDLNRKPRTNPRLREVIDLSDDSN